MNTCEVCDIEIVDGEECMDCLADYGDHRHQECCDEEEGW